MIRNLGPATLFHTLSAAETRWIHLLRILGELVDKKVYSDEELNNLTWQDKCHLIQSDPITCARHFDHQFQLYMTTFLKSNLAPLGKIKDHFYRVEFQQRGSPHIHMLLWIEGAPVYGDQPNEDVVKYIDATMTCKKPSKEAEPQLSQLVVYQTHRHSHTCRKSKKQRCRFGFAKPPMPRTMILTPLDANTSDATKEECKVNLSKIQSFLEAANTDHNMSFEEVLTKLNLSEEAYMLAIRSSLKTNTVFLKRELRDIHTNSYNKACLLAWRANLDVQYIIDTYACAVYIASYISKSSRGMGLLLRQACKEARQGNSDLYVSRFAPLETNSSIV